MNFNDPNRENYSIRPPFSKHNKMTVETEAKTSFQRRWITKKSFLPNKIQTWKDR